MQNDAREQAGDDRSKQHRKTDKAQQLRLAGEIDAAAERESYAVHGDCGLSGVAGRKSEHLPQRIVEDDVSDDVAQVTGSEQLQPAAAAIEQHD